MVCLQRQRMVPNNLKIVCYTGGTCGDLITALIDASNIKFDFFLKTLIHDPTRSQLKKPHLFSSNEDKDSYLQDISKQYNSVPSHDLEYHTLRGHLFISITVEDFDTALWAAQRFKDCHRAHVWEEMINKCGAKSVKDYAQILIDFSRLVRQHTDKIVKLEDIKNGNVIEPLEKIINHSLPQKNRNIYRNWLDIQNNMHIV